MLCKYAEFFLCLFVFFTQKMNAKTYKWCVVPQCTNTSFKTPEKLFIHVPKTDDRKKWLQLARRNPAVLSSTTGIYFCEDHFDLPNDMENYMQYHIMGSVGRIRMKLGILPTKFEFQPDWRKRTSTSTTRPLAINRQRMTFIEDCGKKFEESEVLAMQQAQTFTLMTDSPSTSSVKMVRICTVPNCRTGHANYPEKLSIFKVPRNPALAQQWKQAIAIQGKIINDKALVCERHFKKEDVMTHWSTGKTSYYYKHKMLKKGAVPVVFKRPKRNCVRKKSEIQEDNQPRKSQTKRKKIIKPEAVFIQEECMLPLNEETTEEFVQKTVVYYMEQDDATELIKEDPIFSVKQEPDKFVEKEPVLSLKQETIEKLVKNEFVHFIEREEISIKEEIVEDLKTDSSLTDCINDEPGNISSRMEYLDD